MRQDVLVLTEGEALGSILAARLRASTEQTVHLVHDASNALRVLRTAPIKLIVSDCFVSQSDVGVLLPAFRLAAPYRSFRSIVMTRRVDSVVQATCRQARVDEVVIKPMSPQFIAERVSFWLKRAGDVEVADLISRSSNVVMFPTLMPSEPSHPTH